MGSEKAVSVQRKAGERKWKGMIGWNFGRRFLDAACMQMCGCWRRGETVPNFQGSVLVIKPCSTRIIYM